MQEQLTAAENNEHRFQFAMRAGEATLALARKRTAAVEGEKLQLQEQT